MKTLSLFLISILTIGIFAFPVLLAQEEATTSQELSDSENTDVTIQETLNESTTTSVPENFKTGLKIGTLGEGWMTNSDNTEASIFRTFWISKKQIEIDPQEVKEIREMYKNDSSKMKEELKKLSEGVNETSFGQILLGLGNKMEKYKIVQKEATENKIVFYIIPINSKYNAEDISSISVGTFEVEKNVYPSLVLWTGKLVLNSGDYSGSWDVSFASKTKAYKAWGKVESEKKPGFWGKFAFWKAKKNVNNQGNETNPNDLGNNSGKGNEEKPEKENKNNHGK